MSPYTFRIIGVNLPESYTEEKYFLFSAGVLYNQFLSQADFETLKKYAEVRDLVPVSWSTEHYLLTSIETMLAGCYIHSHFLNLN